MSRVKSWTKNNNARDEFVSREGENIELGGRLCVEEHEAGAED